MVPHVIVRIDEHQGLGSRALDLSSPQKRRHPLEQSQEAPLLPPSLPRRGALPGGHGSRERNLSREQSSRICTCSRPEGGQGVMVAGGGSDADKVFDEMRLGLRDTKVRRGAGAAAPAMGGPPTGHPWRRGRPPPPRRGPSQAALRLPCVACRRSPPPPPPLPLLVMTDFSFASFCAEGTLRGRRCWLAGSGAWARSRSGWWA